MFTDLLDSRSVNINSHKNTDIFNITMHSKSSNGAHLKHLSADPAYTGATVSQLKTASFWDLE